MAVAIDPQARERFVLAQDRDLPTERQTVFILRPVTAGEFVDLTSKVARDLFPHEMAFKGLCGWENLRDAAGAEVVYSAVAARERLAVPWILEIGVAVARLSRITEADVGNSESPQASSSAA